MIEWRPPEKRDGAQDLSESGVLTAIANVKPSVVLNEDITRVDVGTVRRALRGRTLSLLHTSILCDDYSTLKSAAAKRQSVEDGSSTRDVIYDALRLTDGLRPAALLIECVAPFATSPECDMARVRLARWGYHVSVAVLDARDFGGYTSRRRAYLFASLFPDFEYPVPQPRRAMPIWPDLAAEIADCRDVSGSLTVQQSLTSDRAAHLTPMRPMRRV